MGFRRKIPDPPKVDLTPMIDVVFLLLIFFMISTTFIEQPGLSLDLPESGAETLSQQNEDLRVYLTVAGDIYLNQNKVSKQSFQQTLARYDQSIQQKAAFIIMADKDVPHGMVVEIMDIARSIGFRNLAIATDVKTQN